jgi:hypothetical protein
MLWTRGNGSLNRAKKTLDEPAAACRVVVICSATRSPDFGACYCAATAPKASGKLSLANERVGVSIGKSVTGPIQKVDALRTAKRMH